MPLAPNRYFNNRMLQPFMDRDLARAINVKLKASTQFYRGQILGEQVGTDSVKTLTITGTPTSGTFTITYGGQTTAAIAYNATAAAVAAALELISTVGNNAVQTVTLATPTGGNFSLSFGGIESADIAYNASAATVQTALEGIPLIGAGNVTVSGSAGGPYTVTFSGSLANRPITALGSRAWTLVPSNSTVTVAVVNPGGGATANVSATGGPLPGTAVVVTFQNRLGKKVITTPTTTDSFGGGSSPASAFANTTTGVAGNAGVFDVVDKVTPATNGVQTAKGILPFDVYSDASNVLTLGQQSGGGQWGETLLTVPMWVMGKFDTNDLVGLTDAIVSDLGRMIEGSVSAGGILLVG